jgi:tetratricopeptide (TPR) repeat protein
MESLRVPGFDPRRIADLEERLAAPPEPQAGSIADLEMLADLYIQADSYVPALETIGRLLDLPQARLLSPSRRGALEAKAIACRIAQGDCVAALAHAREALRNEAEMDSLAVRAVLHLRCSDALFMLGRLEESRAQGEEGLALADGSQDVGISAMALNQMGRICYREGDLMRARELYEDALALFRRLGDAVSCARVRNNLGLIHKNLCEWDTAIAHLRGSIESYRRLGCLADSGGSLLNLGIVYQKSGDWDRALDHYRQAEGVFLQVGDQLWLSRAGIGIGNVARLQRRFTEAEASLLGALERSRAHDARREEVLALEFLGELDFCLLYHLTLPTNREV